MRILVVEDEPKTAAYLRKGLSEAGFVVDLADNGQAGLELARGDAHDLIVLDVMLPITDGWSVLRDFRQAGHQAPVLFLTARDSIADRVKGLELGADDYLVKPFAFSEFLARVRTLLRRGPSRPTETLQIGGLVIDFLGHKVERDGRRIDLTAKEFVLLSLLARRSGEVLSRTLLSEQVWDMNFDSDTNVVDVAIRRLRMKIDTTFSVPLIHTVRGSGYVLEQR